jgi:hypothetical protein
MITMIFLTIEVSAKPGYGSLPGGSEWLAAVPRAVGGCWAVVADAGDGGFGRYRKKNKQASYDIEAKL